MFPYLSNGVPMRAAVAALVSLTLLTACAPKDEAPAADDAAVQAPAAPTVADFAGTWQIQAVIGTDTVPSTMTIAADGSSTLTLEGRPPVALTVSISGDSVVTQSAEYESVLRRGTMVTVRTAAVKSGDNMMTGNMMATYKSATGEEMAHGTVTGTKQP
jgi:glucose/arabinose dehydrogenase